MTSIQTAALMIGSGMVLRFAAIQVGAMLSPLFDLVTSAFNLRR